MKVKSSKSSREPGYAIVQAEVDKKPLPKTGRAVGIDVGVQNFCVDSDGIAFENYVWRTIEKIKRAQKQLSRKQRRSRRESKA